MKQFFKFFTASCLGVFAAIAMISLVGMLLISMASSKDTTVASNSILKLDLSRIIPEKSGNVKTDPFNMDATEAIGLRDLRRTIQNAAEDSNIEGILLTHKDVSLGQATIKSIVDELNKFKESGKWIYSYGDYYGQSAYFVNSTADSIFLNPNGMVDVKGYATMIPFFKEGMDKLGVKFDIFYAGNFKSATEPFRRTNMSEPNKLQTRTFLDGMLDVFQEQVTIARGFDVATLDAIMNDYKGINGKSALQANLVDELLFWDDLQDILRKKLDIKENGKIEFIDLEEYKSKITLKEEGPRNNRVAIVYAEGNVGYGADEKGSISDNKYMKIFEKIRADKKIKAVVLRVNSGGGSALTSDIIHKEIAHLKADGIPVVSSFGDYAASGGYYIAANSDTIVSMPNTLTGSIGVFSMLPNAQKLANEKLGVNFDTVRTHQHAITMSPYLDMSPDQKAMVQSETDAVYDQFLTIVSNGRGMTIEETHEIAQGRVWTGMAGKEIGLVDVIGDLEDAVKIAGDMAGLDKWKIKEYPSIKKEWYEDLIKGLNKGSSTRALIPNDDLSRTLIKDYSELKSILEMEGPQCRIPYLYKFN